MNLIDASPPARHYSTYAYLIYETNSNQMVSKLQVRRILLPLNDHDKRYFSQQSLLRYYFLPSFTILHSLIPFVHSSCEIWGGLHLKRNIREEMYLMAFLHSILFGRFCVI